VDAGQVADVEGTLVTAGVLGLVALGVTRLVAPDAFVRFRGAFAGGGPVVGGLVAVLATLGSLWFSEAAHFPPCELCWYQRIAMYPLALILPIAAWRRDPSIRLYGIVLAAVGLAISAWHNIVETFPERDLGGACDPSNPCTIRWVEGLGFWTIPRMAFASFAFVLVALILDRPLEEEP
jgi:disulfide bond formation protein DsbB